MPKTRKHYLAVLCTIPPSVNIWEVSYKERKLCLAAGDSRHLLSGLVYCKNYPVRKATPEEIRKTKRCGFIYQSLSPEVKYRG